MPPVFVANSQVVPTSNAAKKLRLTQCGILGSLPQNNEKDLSSKCNEHQILTMCPKNMCYRKMKTS